MEIKETLQDEQTRDVTDERDTHDLSTTRLPQTVEETDELTLRDFLVLVVEDSVDSAVVISMDLQQQGYRVITASDGEQAVKIANKTNPDIILMDIEMPELDGLAATRRIREDEALQSVPIIAVTAFETEGFQHAARDAGFDAYLTKPIDFEKLHELMRRLLPIKR
ncbi:MAG TPA: response regulator [Pyrinomonadaceae bacterium]|nr:response regulator [Pyrinomonadaceae bacterium]